MEPLSLEERRARALAEIGGGAPPQGSGPLLPAGRQPAGPDLPDRRARALDAIGRTPEVDTDREAFGIAQATGRGYSGTEARETIEAAPGLTDTYRRDLVDYTGFAETAARLRRLREEGDASGDLTAYLDAAANAPAFPDGDDWAPWREIQADARQRTGWQPPPLADEEFGRLSVRSLLSARTAEERARLLDLVRVGDRARQNRATAPDATRDRRTPPRPPLSRDRSGAEISGADRELADELVSLRRDAETPDRETAIRERDAALDRAADAERPYLDRVLADRLASDLSTTDSAPEAMTRAYLEGDAASLLAELRRASALPVGAEAWREVSTAQAFGTTGGDARVQAFRSEAERDAYVQDVARRLAALDARTDEYRPARIEAALGEAEGVRGVLGALTEGEGVLDNVATLVGTNLARQPGEAAATTLAGAFTGPVGAAVAGLLSGFSSEERAAIQEAVTRAGVDLGDPRQAQAFAEDVAEWEAINSRARRRGTAIGLVNFVTAGLASRLGGAAAAPGRTLGGRTALGLAGTATDTAGEFGGELAAQAAAGDDLDLGEATLEAVTGLGQSAATTASGTVYEGGRRTLGRPRRAGDAPPIEGLRTEDRPPEAVPPEVLNPEAGPPDVSPTDRADVGVTEAEAMPAEPPDVAEAVPVDNEQAAPPAVEVDPAAEYPVVVRPVRGDTFTITAGETTDEVTGEGEAGRVVGTVRPDALRVTNAGVSESERGRGHGVRMYEAAAQEAARRGVALESDVEVTPDAARVWEALERRGYAVERSPEATVEDVDGVEKWVASGPVFRIADPATPERVAQLRHEKKGDLSDRPATIPARQEAETFGDFVTREREALTAEADRELEAALREEAEAAGTAEAVDAGAVAVALAERSENPAVLLRGWRAARDAEAQALDPAQSVEAAIAEHVPFISSAEAADVSPDLTGAQRRAFFRAPRQDTGTGAGSGQARASLAEAADEVSRASGLTVTAEDVAAFIRTYPGGPSAYRAEVRRARRGIEDRLRDVTGEPVSAQRVEGHLAALDPAPSIDPAPATNPAGYGARNTLVTESAYRAALADLGEIAPFSNPGLDPRKWQAGLTVVAYHSEALAREGVAVAGQAADVIARAARDLPRSFDPHLRELFDAVRSERGADLDAIAAEAVAQRAPEAEAARRTESPSDAAPVEAAPTEGGPAGARGARAQADEAPREAPAEPDARREAPRTPIDAALAASALSPTAPASAAGDGPAVVALNRAEVQLARERLGLDRLAPAQRRRWSEVLEAAQRDGLAEEAPALASAVLAGEVGPLRDIEYAALVVAAARLTVRYDVLTEDAARATETGDATRAATARKGMRDALDALDKIQRAADLSATETARALSIRQLRLDAETFEPATVLRAALARKGDALTDAEEANLLALTERVRTLEAKLRRLEGRADGAHADKTRAAAERAVERAAGRYQGAAERASRSRRAQTKRAVRLDELARERSEIRDELARLGLRVNDVFGLSADAAVLVGRLALNLAESGALRFADVVAGVRAVVPDVTEEQVAAALADAEERRRGRRPKRRTEPESVERVRVEREMAKKDVRRAVAKLDQDGKLARFFAQALGTPRALMATADVSATLRQGFILGARFPKQAARSFGNATRAMFSEHQAERIDLAIREDPRQARREAAGLYLSPRGDGAPFTEREEAFTASWLEAVPGFGAVVRGAERHYSTHLNLLRVAAFDYFLDAYPDATGDQLKGWARYVNAASGRGSLGDIGPAAQNVASGVFFSPRFLTSRWQALLSEPVRSALTPGVRKEIAKTYAAAAGVLLIGHALWNLAFGDEGETGLDPRDSDFLKMVTGNLRVDTGAGTVQVIRLLFQIGLTATDTWGLSTPPKDARTDRDAYDLTTQYLRYKLAPIPSGVLALSTKKDAVGNDVTPGEVAARSLVPLGFSQTYDAYGASGADAALAVYLGNLWGVSVDVYDDPLQRLPVKRIWKRAEYRPTPGDADEAAFKDEFARRVLQRRATLEGLADDELREEVQAIAGEARSAADFVTTGDPLGSPDVLDLLTRADYEPSANPPDEVEDRDGYARAFAERFAGAVRAERQGLDAYRDPTALRDRLSALASDARALTRAESTGDPLAPDLPLFQRADYRPSASPPRAMPEAERPAYEADWRRRLAERVAAERDLLAAYGDDADGLKERLKWHAAEARKAARSAAGY